MKYTRPFGCMGSELKCWLDFNILLIGNHISRVKIYAYLFYTIKQRSVPAELEVLTGIHQNTK